MRPNEILKHVRHQPFHPFRIFLSDGASYDVRHPELILVTKSEIVIALGTRNGGVPEETVYADPIHVTRIERINGKKSVSRKRKR